MAGMFFTMQEVADKLSKSEEQIHELIQEGKLREFRDGTKLLFKVSEVESLASQLPIIADGEPVEILPNDSEVVLEPIAEPTPAAAPTPTVDELDIVEDAAAEPDDDGDDELLLGDFSLDETQEDVLLEPEPANEELSLDDSLSILAGDDNSDKTSAVEDISSESDDVLTDDADAADDISIEPQAEITGDDSMDVLLTDDEPAEAEVTEDVSLEATSIGDELLISDESSADMLLDDEDSLKLAETTAAVEENAEQEFDLGDSFDILMDDDASDQASIEKDGSLLSDDTLGGLLAPDAPKVKGSDDELLSSITKADTAMGNTGVNVLAETDSDFQLASDTKADTVIPDEEDDLDDLDDLDMSDGDFLAESTGLGNLDDDLNLDSIGSGSGLLDLSLQADDTSLGAVLDDILPSEDEIEAVPVEVEEATIADEADKIFEADDDDQAMITAPEPARQMTARYVAAAPTAVENACGIAMFLPAIMVAFAAIILLFGLKGISPMLLTKVSSDLAGFPMIWWIVIGTSVLFLVILMFGALLGGGSGQTKAKAKKPKKGKKPKKAKKSKKAKKKK
ncbi:MAG: helix-turn-helix domain-containing protein [Planctomycetes bacterium]|nr:helix-turn-helix domain-containing protein [Planctomycetota bacterium]